MIHPATSDLVASCSPQVHRTWGTHSTTPPFLYTLLFMGGSVGLLYKPAADYRRRLDPASITSRARRGWLAHRL